MALNVLFEGQSILEKEIKIDSNSGNCVETTIDWKDNVKLWSEFTPNVYRLHAVLSSQDGVCKKDLNFGFRELRANGTRFDINGRPIFLRGTLECCVFPKTGYPAMDNEYWAKIYATCKSYGLNHVRFHSWCPPAAAFHVADSMGVYLQVECGEWTSAGDGNKQDQWIKEESERILKEYGNHPSFCMLAYGNEPSGNNQVNYLNDLVVYWKQHDGGRRLYTSAGGWPLIPDADYFNTDKPRIGGIGRIENILNVYEPRTDYDHRERILKDLPVVSHEIGQWCVYPDFKEINKYTGVLKAKNFEIFRETLNEKGLEDMAEKFLYASGRLRTLCYKMDIEAALRTPGFAGFQLLDLHDFPGQGTALVGVLNPFWESKGYVDDREYSQFCNQTVPLARMSKLIWKNNEQFKADIEFAHFGEKTLHDATILWNIETKEGNVVKSGSFKRDLPIGNLIEVGSIEYPLNTFSAPTQLTLKVNVENTAIANSWHIWVYPSEKKEIQKKPYVTNKLDKTAIDKLNQGENVLFLSYGKIAPQKGGDIRVTFTPIFWNTAWTYNVSPHTLGFLCDPAHAAFASFPNDGHSDFQWKDLAVNCNAMVMNDFPHDFRPLVYVIDDWFKNRKLGVLFEGKVGKGNLMVCSIDLNTDLENRLSAAQFKQSILEYMASSQFNPQKEITPELIKNMLIK
ncbi:MAG: beta-galactosidase [Parabacteroides sp.]|nr:beta-galactosidase [Parabacteroides sp.]